MRVLVLGSGIIGVTTAYVLATRGYDVEVVDRRDQAATETSYANGGQLSYSHAEPWANPAVLPKVLKWMLDDTAPLVLRPRLDWRMISWGLKFLSNCNKRSAEANTVTMLRLGLYSRKMMEALSKATNISFHHQHSGILHVFTDHKEFDAAKRQAAFQEQFGCQEKTLTAEECLNLEPTLQHSNKTIIGGIHAHLDESGDMCSFTRQLANLCEKEYGVTFHYNTTIQKIQKDGDKISCIQTDKGELQADAYVMSLGSYSAMMLRQIGIKVPIYPMKGYSLTFKANHFAPNISITDQNAKIVYSRFGPECLRVAGTAEFAGYNDSINPKRIEPIVKAISTLFPKVLEEPDAITSEWACLRPSTPDGPPIIGKTPYSNLFMNTGHGTLGWTQSAGSAFLLADTLEGKQTEISLMGMDLDRYL